MKSVIADTESDEQCTQHDPMGYQCKNRKTSTITYLKRGEDEHYICTKRCLSHGNHYAAHLIEKYDLVWLKMEFDD